MNDYDEELHGWSDWDEDDDWYDDDDYWDDCDEQWFEGGHDE